MNTNIDGRFLSMVAERVQTAAALPNKWNRSESIPILVMARRHCDRMFLGTETIEEKNVREKSLVFRLPKELMSGA